MTPLIALELHSEPRGLSLDMIMIPAPVTPTTAPATSHSRLPSRSPCLASSASTRARRSLLIVPTTGGGACHPGIPAAASSTRCQVGASLRDRPPPDQPLWREEAYGDGSPLPLRWCPVLEANLAPVAQSG